MDARGSELLALALKLILKYAVRVLDVDGAERGHILRDDILWRRHQQFKIGGTRQLKSGCCPRLEVLPLHKLRVALVEV